MRTHLIFSSVLLTTDGDALFGSHTLLQLHDDDDDDDDDDDEEDDKDGDDDDDDDADDDDDDKGNNNVLQQWQPGPIVGPKQ